MATDLDLVRSEDGREMYWYSPIPHYSGKVLKCQGLVSVGNREWMPEKHPGVIELAGYRGDRITADSHQLYEGF